MLVGEVCIQGAAQPSPSRRRPSAGRLLGSSNLSNPRQVSLAYWSNVAFSSALSTSILDFRDPASVDPNPSCNAGSNKPRTTNLLEEICRPMIITPRESDRPGPRQQPEAGF